MNKLFFLCLFVLGNCWGITEAKGQIASRAPFVLEIPDVAAARYTAPVIRLPMPAVPKLKFRVIEPFAREISYGNIIVTINGEGVNRGCDKGSDAEGKFMLCEVREARLGGYTLAKGKNVVEIRATNRQMQEYYASYVLLLGEKGAVINRPAWTNGAAETFKGRKFALLVGVSEYKFQDAGLKNLAFADDDALALAEFLKSPAGGRFSAADIKLLVNQEATIASLEAALSEIGKRATSNDLVFIFIAGHGAPDPLAPQNLYFLLHDSKVVDMPRTAFPMSRLKLVLDSQIYAQRVIALIDTCHSAGVNQKNKSLVTGRQLEQDEENNISNFALTDQLFKQTGRAILTSSDVNETSQESAKWDNHGVFTWALLNGLKGQADANRDKLITVGELFQFAYSSVQKATNSQQTPRALPGVAKDLTLAFADGSSAKSAAHASTPQQTGAQTDETSADDFLATRPAGENTREVKLTNKDAGPAPASSGTGQVDNPFGKPPVVAKPSVKPAVRPQAEAKSSEAGGNVSNLRRRFKLVKRLPVAKNPPVPPNPATKKTPPQNLSAPAKAVGLPPRLRPPFDPKTKALAQLGVTFWRLRPVQATDAPATPVFPVTVANRKENWVAERVSSATQFQAGDRVRFTIEASRAGYLYIANRELYSDGTMGEAEIIFPTLRTRGGDNQVVAGSLIEIPAMSDAVPYFSIRPRRPDYAGEELIVLLTDEELPGLEKGLRAQPLARETLAQWQDAWGAEIEILEAEQGSGTAYTPAEAKAAASTSRQLTQDDPLPQTIYRLQLPARAPLLVPLRLQVAAP